MDMPYSLQKAELAARQSGPEPRERVARALSRLQGHPPDIRFESKPMWESFLPEADAALEAAGVEPLIALLRQFEADAALPKMVRDQAAAAFRAT
jgi:hypothetical protein